MKEFIESKRAEGKSTSDVIRLMVEEFGLSVPEAVDYIKRYLSKEL